MLSEPDLQNWVGREQTDVDTVTTAPLEGLASLLDCPGFEKVLPPLAHWLYFLPRTRQEQLGADGHPLGGNFLPPSPYPRRMWAGGAIRFLHDIAIGDEISRLTRIASINPKTGRSGPMMFITLLHEISVHGVVAIRETQDLVYRPAIILVPPVMPPETPRLPTNSTAECEQILTLDSVELFRFSALTFNAHRIHYDRDYARNVEGYPGLVVHGPLLATLMMRFFRNSFPKADLAQFCYRSIRPVYDRQHFKILGATSGDETKLWIIDQEGYLVMDAVASKS